MAENRAVLPPAGAGQAAADDAPDGGSDSVLEFRLFSEPTSTTVRAVYGITVRARMSFG